MPAYIRWSEAGAVGAVRQTNQPRSATGVAKQHSARVVRDPDRRTVALAALAKWRFAANVTHPMHARIAWVPKTLAHRRTGPNSDRVIAGPVYVFSAPDHTERRPVNAQAGPVFAAFQSGKTRRVPPLSRRSRMIIGRSRPRGAVSASFRRIVGRGRGGIRAITPPVVPAFFEEPISREFPTGVLQHTEDLMSA